MSKTNLNLNLHLESTCTFRERNCKMDIQYRS